jgi:hypothetical protein
LSHTLSRLLCCRPFCLTVEAEKQEAAAKIARTGDFAATPAPACDCVFTSVVPVSCLLCSVLRLIGPLTRLVQRQAGGSALRFESDNKDDVNECKKHELPHDVLCSDDAMCHIDEEQYAELVEFPLISKIGKLPLAGLFLIAGWDSPEMLCERVDAAIDQCLKPVCGVSDLHIKLTCSVKGASLLSVALTG